MDENQKIIYDLLKEVREDQKSHGKELVKQSTCLNNLQDDVGKMEKHVSKNTDNIAEHMRRTELLENLHKDNQNRIKKNEERLDVLEFPLKAKKWIMKNIKSILVITGTTITVITKIMGLW